MMRKNLQFPPSNNCNSGKIQQLQSLNLEELDIVGGGILIGLLLPAVQK